MTSIDTTRWYANPAARNRHTSSVAGSALSFHRTLDGYAATPLSELPELAVELGVGRVFLKDESNRMGLPAFKILGASWAVCRAISERLGVDARHMTVETLRRELAGNPAAARGLTLVTATDGNHGRAVARMASLLGVSARIYTPNGLSQAATAAIRAEGAELIVLDATYDDVVAQAAASVTDRDFDLLIQDTSWNGYASVPQWIVDGYMTLFAEIDGALKASGIPKADLVACPVGVGSPAHAMVDHYRSTNGGPALLSVEPATAACVAVSLAAGAITAVDTSRPTIMTGLNCGTPSDLGWPSLLGGLDAAISVSDDETRTAVADLARLGQDSGPCGAASLAGVRAALNDRARREALGIGADSVVVLVSTEGLAANPLPQP